VPGRGGSGTPGPAGEPAQYSRIAGHSKARLEALSDGVFAIAMTLLVLDLRAPASEAILSERDLLAALVALEPNLLVYGLSFLTLGIFWVGQQTQLNQLTRSDRDLTWLHLAFLCAVTLLPAITALMAEFIRYRTALVVYWADIFALGALLFASWHIACGRGLFKDAEAAALGRAVQRRIVRAQGLYFAALLLGLFGARISLWAIVAIQVNYAIAPRVRFLQRL
jgi:uncharacterized membrane protein